MNTLITGASGFLGRFLSRKLRERGERVVETHSKNCDLTKADSLESFNAIRFDCIYHLAAWTQAGDFCLRHPGEQWLINQKINTHMLDWWARAQPQAKLIAMGTSCAYDPSLPHIEEKYLSGCPIESLFTYAMTKRMLLTGLQALHKQFGLRFLYLIPSTLYGPDYHTDGRQPHFIFDLIRKILRGVYEDEPVILWGDGEQRRELVHVENFIDVLLALVETEENTLINIGAGKEQTIKEFARIICENVGYPFEKIQFDETRYVGARSKCLSIEKLMKILPTFTPRSLEDGLSLTIEWSKHNLVRNASTHRCEKVPG